MRRKDVKTFSDKLSVLISWVLQRFYHALDGFSGFFVLRRHNNKTLSNHNMPWALATYSHRLCAIKFETFFHVLDGERLEPSHDLVQHGQLPPQQVKRLEWCAVSLVLLAMQCIQSMPTAGKRHLSLVSRSKFHAERPSSWSHVTCHVLALQRRKEKKTHFCKLVPLSSSMFCCFPVIDLINILAINSPPHYEYRSMLALLKSTVANLKQDGPWNSGQSWNFWLMIAMGRAISSKPAIMASIPGGKQLRLNKDLKRCLWSRCIQ